MLSLDRQAGWAKYIIPYALISTKKIGTATREPISTPAN